MSEHNSISVTYVGGPDEAPDRMKRKVAEVEACAHDFSGWREFRDGKGGGGGFQVCVHCGIEAWRFAERLRTSRGR